MRGFQWNRVKSRWIRHCRGMDRQRWWGVWEGHSWKWEGKSAVGVWTGRDGGECGRGGTAGNGRERVLGVWTGRDGGECGRGTAGNGRERVLGVWTDRDGGEYGSAKMGQWGVSIGTVGSVHRRMFNQGQIQEF